jgi:hypothetical protein
MVKYGVLFEVRTDFLNNTYLLDKLRLQRGKYIVHVTNSTNRVGLLFEKLIVDKLGSKLSAFIEYKVIFSILIKCLHWPQS